jgi:hypothetical protein
MKRDSLTHVGPTLVILFSLLHLTTSFSIHHFPEYAQRVPLPAAELSYSVDGFKFDVAPNADRLFCFP